VRDNEINMIECHQILAPGEKVMNSESYHRSDAVLREIMNAGQT